MPILGLPEYDAAEVTQPATRMEEEATSTNPGPNRLQRWRNQAVAVLSSPVVSGAPGSVLATCLGVVLPQLSAGG
ncbi:hypothetical protein [Streptomyces violaceus]|uniref:Uncharacterized protein n=1 Tax=Streptomyces violaceus TaxID=1936 RepID=A0ABY9U4B6_STRVL|nr:hypothetical protein [Streptomyces janthinus]WND17686.1 hypothetical protein RI060_10180 [Streptomyces janthinus]GGS36089.1 hypothetical protein GCM10010270_01300 [Streptomyces janthinus]